MGRGLGTVQRSILETLRRYGDIQESFLGEYSAAGIHGGAWSIGALAEKLDGNHESIRRAVQALRTRGLVDVARVKVGTGEVKRFRDMGIFGYVDDFTSHAIIGLAVWSTDPDVSTAIRTEAKRRTAESKAKSNARMFSGAALARLEAMDQG
jgi:hypothetical protein